MKEQEEVSGNKCTCGKERNPCVVHRDDDGHRKETMAMFLPKESPKEVSENPQRCDKCFIGDLHKAREFYCDDPQHCGCPCVQNNPPPRKENTPEPSLDSLVEEKLKEFEQEFQYTGEPKKVGKYERLDFYQTQAIKSWLSQAFKEVAEKKVEGIRELFLSLIPAAKEIPFMFDYIEIRQQEILEGHLATYDKVIGYNAAREEMEKNIKSLPLEAFTDIINKIK